MALSDEALQLWNKAEALLEERVDGQRLAEGGERFARLILLDVDEVDACERIEVPGLQGQNPVAVAKRAVVFADDAEHVSTLVPALGPVWLAGTMSSRMGMAIAGMLAKSRNCVQHLRVHLGVTRLQPQPPDLRHIVFLLDLGALKAGE